MKVILKKGDFANLPSWEESNVLLFAEDKGLLFQGAGTNKDLVNYGSVLTGYADLADLSRKNPQVEGKLYLTDDAKLYFYNGSSYEIISSGGSTGGGSGSGGSSVRNRTKLTVATNGQTVFNTGVQTDKALNEIVVSVIVNGIEYIENVNVAITNKEIVLTWNNTGAFALATTDIVYMYYAEKITIVNTTNHDHANMTVLNELQEDSNGKLTYKGLEIGSKSDFEFTIKEW